MYDDKSPSIWFNHTISDSTKITHPITGERIFSRAIRVSAACTLSVRHQGKRQAPDDTNYPAVSTNTQPMLFAAGESRACSVDMIFSTGTTLNGATIEVAY